MVPRASITWCTLQAARAISRMSQHVTGSSVPHNAAFHTAPDASLACLTADAAFSAQTMAGTRQPKVFAAPWMEPLKRALGHGGAIRPRLS